MESLIHYDSHPELTSPVFIECLPGIGNVGKIAGDKFAETVGAEKFASIYSKHLPPQVFLDDDCVIDMVCNELWFAKDVNGRDFIFLKGEFQASTPEGQFELTKEIYDLVKELGISKIITLGGYGTGNMVEEYHVYGAVTQTDLKDELIELGVEFSPSNPQAGILGASGVLLGFGKLDSIPAVCLMGETSGYFLDHKSAMNMADILSKMFGVEMDMADLQEKSDQIDALTAEVKKIEEQDTCEDLNYIG